MPNASSPGNNDRNLIVFSDGTGNSAAKLFKTNVWRIYDALDLNCCDQIALYDDGVGTASLPLLALIGGAFGWGLKRNVLDLYIFLCRNYQKGDRIFAFGFSRGAFTIRVLTGLIAGQGLITGADGAELKRLASWAYRDYRARRYKQTWGLVTPLRWVRDLLFSTWDGLRGRLPYKASERCEVEIDFLGLWDTVDAYGLPFDELTRGWDRWIWPLSLPNQRLWEKVKKACHALALDDERQTFHPLLWDESTEAVNGTSTLDDERLSQVWFAGVHSNVGGGYPDDALAYTPLCWIAEEATKKGLRFMSHLCAPGQIPEAWKQKATPCSTMHDSRRGPGSYYRYAPRRLEGLRRDIEGRALIRRPKIHTSVFERISTSREAYAPIVLPETYAVVDRAGRILAGDADSAVPSAAPNPYEHSTQATSRSRRQEIAWNVVWWRRGVHFLTVATTLVVLFVPLWPGRDEIGYLDYALPIMSAGVRLVGGFLPDFMSGWLAHYETYPLQLFVAVVAIAALMSAGTQLKQMIADRMREVWATTGHAAGRVTIAPEPSSALYRVRRSRTYFGFFRFFSRSLWPHLFGIAMLILIIGGIPVGLIRLSFDTSTVLGWTCRDYAPLARPQPGPWVFAFEPRTFCHATGIPIERRGTYRVEIVLPEPDRRWRDGEIDVLSPAGFTTREGPLLLYPFVPLRRVLQADWFVPIARVGSTGAEHYGLTEPVTVFTAQRHGRLMLFVNDVIVPWPNWHSTYANNSGGTACVRVTKLQPNEPTERVPTTPPVCSL